MTDLLRQAHAALRCLCAVLLVLGHLSFAAMAQTPPADRHKSRLRRARALIRLLY